MGLAPSFEVVIVMGEGGKEFEDSIMLLRMKTSGQLLLELEGSLLVRPKRSRKMKNAGQISRDKSVIRDAR